LESGVGPLMRIGMGIENASKCSTENFVGALGDGIFDFGFLFGCECRHLAKKERERERDLVTASSQLGDGFPMFRFLHGRAYGVAATNTANALQNIDRQHERILRIVKRRIAERRIISSQASFPVSFFSYFVIHNSSSL